MKLTGLITEYNPFHNGHAYHLKKSFGSYRGRCSCRYYER